MIKNVLCASDGSKISAKAVNFAISLAKELGAKLTVLTVERVSRASAAKSAFWDSTVLNAGDAITRAEFRSVAEKAKKAELRKVQCVTVSSRDIADAIAAYAKKQKHDHIVIGSHGHRGVQRLVLGSIAEAVVAEAHCPVTIVR
jgi:nucleotide-binding universal stress UspA family protein